MMRPLALLLLTGVMLAQQPAYFRFDVNQDTISGAVDFSFLNEPLTAADRLFVRDGHFFRVGPDLKPHTEDDTRVRLFGANLAFSGNLPSPEDAPRVAKRLRRLGMNVVRLHHLDTQPDANPANAASLLTAGPYPTLNPFSVERLRVFLNALRDEGIYVNLNLKVGYQFRPGIDGLPVPAAGTVPDQSKPLHIFWPKLVERQTEFATKVIEALALEDDPVLGLVEINNESSLIYSYQTGQIDRFVSGEYRLELSRQWNQYLGRRYEWTEALRRAWAMNEGDGPELLDGLEWRTELHGGARASIQPTGDRSIRIRVDNGSSTAIAKQVGYSLNTARPYVGVIEMRADLPDGVSRGVYWDIKEDVSPWRTVRAQTVQVTNQWQRFTTSFTPSLNLNGTGRFAVQVEQLEGTSIEVRNWSLSQPARRGLGADESLEAANIAVPDAAANVSEARQEDWIRFLTDADRRYLNSIRDAVRAKAGALVPIAGTQMDFGGLMNLDSHDGLDYQDRHYYVDHYQFPGTAWDGRNWTIGETSNIATGLSPFVNAAWSRESGRPFTVSEFNQPWPNTYGAETDPALGAFGSFQDWDGLMHFAYAHNRDWEIGVPHGFNLNGDWTKLVNFGQSAWLFRTGAVTAGDPWVVPFSEAQRLGAARRSVNGNIGTYVQSTHGVLSSAALSKRVAIERSEEALAQPGQSDAAPEFAYEGRLIRVSAARVAAVLGFAGTGQRMEAGPLGITVETARGFACVTLTPLDGAVLAESSRMLLTSPGYTLRSQPGAERPQELVRYPGSTTRWTLEPDQNRPSGNLNGGIRPVWMERVPMTVELRLAGAGMTVYPLTASGERMEAIPAEATSDGFRVHLDVASPWFEIEVARD
jgi:hypothetical protein